MTVTIEKWGKTLALRIPPALARAVPLKNGSTVYLSVRGGALVVEPADHHAYELDDLLKRVSRKNLHGSVQTGPAVGVEAW